MSTPRINDKNINLGLGVMEIGEFVSGAFVSYRDLGAIKGTCNIQIHRESVTYETGRPLVEIKEEITKETLAVSVTLSELSIANIKAVLGAGVITSSVVPVFLDTTGLAPLGDLTTATSSVGISDILTLGGQTAINPSALRFTHEKSDGKRVILEVYKAQPSGNLAMPFSETDWTQYECTFKGLADLTRAQGAQLFQLIIERS